MSPGARRTPALLAVALGLAAGLFARSPALGASRPPARGAHAMAVTVDADATRAAVETLRRGGNAVDGAVAAAFVLAVTFPAAGNLGGGGFLLHRSADGSSAALDFRETAPRALTADRFLDPEGRPAPGRSTRGGLAVGVPGTVAGLAEAHRRWGSRPWEELLAPAIRLAEEGFAISRFGARALATRHEDLASEPGSRRIFTRDGEPLREGDRLVQPDLARALRRIAEDGPQGFYFGPTAGAIAATVRAAGGVLDEQDLAAYRPRWREPLTGTYRGHRVITFPPPSGGGVVLLQSLGMLERFDLSTSGFASSLTVHRMVEAERRAFADRSLWLGDPDFAEPPTSALLDPVYLASRAATIRDRRATPSGRVAPGRPSGLDGSETTHLSVADAGGGVVALTLTLNEWFGSGLVAEGAGVLLNNEIDDFALGGGTANRYGLTGGDANAIAPGKRPLSSMTPTIVEARGGGSRPLLVLGSPGGSTIPTTVLQVLVNVLDHGLPLQEAVDAPRFHHQWVPDSIDHEPRAFPRDVAEALVRRGHALREREPIGDVSAIGLDGDGSWLGAADPRREGSAAGF